LPGLGKYGLYLIQLHPEYLLDSSPGFARDDKNPARR